MGVVGVGLLVVVVVVVVVVVADIIILSSNQLGIALGPLTTAAALLEIGFAVDEAEGEDSGGFSEDLDVGCGSTNALRSRRPLRGTLLLVMAMSPLWWFVLREVVVADDGVVRD